MVTNRSDFIKTPYGAYLIVVGMDDGADHEDIIEAYQYLIDTGIINTMPGAYGRMAQQLIDAGECTI